MAEKRTCSGCGTDWYSADTDTWICSKYGTKIPAQKTQAIKQAIEYFENAIKESDEIIEECSEDLIAQLEEQKKHFVTALKAMKYMLRYRC